MPLAASATDVYVDQTFSGSGPTGDASCPFPTIQAGLAAAALLASPPIVHVAGGSPALTYAETGMVGVNTGVTLVGDGPAKTIISASGACGNGTCAVTVNGGGVLDGFTVISPLGDGVVTALTAPPPVVKNVSANGSKGSGILALGAAELGPNIVANLNGIQGLFSNGKGLVHVIGTTNAFDGNSANGIDVEGATLQFEGGSASGNAFNGIRFGAAGQVATTHIVANLVATKNKNTGISAFSGQNLRLSASTLLTNVNYGLNYTYIVGYNLDIGGVNLGGNTFGGATVAARNGKAGIYLCHSRGLATQPADGDSFSVCAPTQLSLTGCDMAPASYVDVAYAATVPGDPVKSLMCMMGP